VDFERFSSNIKTAVITQQPNY